LQHGERSGWSMERTTSHGSELGRIIQPVEGGIEMNDRHFRLEDVNELTEALVARSEGRLRELQVAAELIEERLKARADDGKARISRAFEIAQSEINRRLEKTATDSARIYEERYRAGYETGHAEGLETGTREGRERGFREGYAEGTEKGILEGRESGRRAIEQEIQEYFRTASERAVAQLNTLADDLRGEWTRSLSAARESLLDLALRIAETIVHGEIQSRPDVLFENTRTALERLEVEGLVIIDVHPEDRASLEEFLGRSVSDLLDPAAVELRERADLDRGGLIVRSNAGFVDASVRGQLDNVRRRLREAGGVI
ncbi:MAG: hypothetical protein KDC38_18405, partial [Planctomycetes bacterium]|nr:hypothetical protein [Planctomycetota bacterium]